MTTATGELHEDRLEELVDDLERKAKAADRKAFGRRCMIAAADAIALIAEIRRLERIAKAATAFVDEQGKRVNVRRLLDSGDDFAGERFDDMVNELEAAGR